MSPLLLAQSDGLWLTGRKPRHTQDGPQNDSALSGRQERGLKGWFNNECLLWVFISVPLDIISNWCFHRLLQTIVRSMCPSCVCNHITFLVFLFPSASSGQEQQRNSCCVNNKSPKDAEARHDASNSFHGNSSSDAQINTLFTGLEGKRGIDLFI